MRALCFALMSVVSASAFGQVGFSGSAFGASGVSVGDAQLSLRAEPPSSGLLRLFGGGFRGRRGPDCCSFFTRYLMDRANHIYFGYELLIDEQQPGAYLVTFGKLGLTPLEMSMDSIQRIPPNAHLALDALSVGSPRIDQERTGPETWNPNSARRTDPPPPLWSQSRQP